MADEHTDDALGISGPGGWGVTAKGTAVMLLLAFVSMNGALAYISLREQVERQGEHVHLANSITALDKAHAAALDRLRLQLAVRDCLDHMSPDHLDLLRDQPRLGTPHPPSAEDFLRTWCRWMGY